MTLNYYEDKFHRNLRLLIWRYDRIYIRPQYWNDEVRSIRLITSFHEELNDCYKGIIEGEYKC
jgi:hypothetical protein